MKASKKAIHATVERVLAAFEKKLQHYEHELDEIESSLGVRQE